MLRSIARRCALVRFNLRSPCPCRIVLPLFKIEAAVLGTARALPHSKMRVFELINACRGLQEASFQGAFPVSGHERQELP